MREIISKHIQINLLIVIWCPLLNWEVIVVINTQSMVHVRTLKHAKDYDCMNKTNIFPMYTKANVFMVQEKKINGMVNFQKF